MRDELTILFDAAKNVVDIVWEETPGIKHGLDETRNCTDRHVLCMRMAIPLIEKSMARLSDPL